MAVSPVYPPVVALGRLAGWKPLPLSVRDARRGAAGLRQRLAGTEPAPIAAGPTGPPPVAVAKSADTGPGTGTERNRRAARGAFAAFLRRRAVPERIPPEETDAAAVGETSAVAAERAEPLAVVRDLAVRRERTEALRRVSLTITPGETVALMGRNGAGKSTLLNTLVGMVEPASGSVLVGGRTPHRTQPRELIREVGLVPQEPRDLLYADTVAAECAAADGDADAPPGTCHRLVGELLPDVPDTTHPRDLSEGQRLVLALAVVLTGRPPLLLLDEPTRGLDYAAKARLVGVLRALAAEGHAIVLATHDVELAAELAHRVVILADGEIVADGPTPHVVVSSPAFAPQVAKILAPQEWLTVTQVRAALASGTEGIRSDGAPESRKERGPAAGGPG